MKKTLKFIIPALLLMLVFSLMFVPASADGEKAYAVFESEEHYKNDPNHPIIVSSLDTINADHINRGGYLVAYRDLKLEDNVMITNGSRVTIDLAGNTLTSTGALTVGANGEFVPTFLTVKNGRLVHSYAQFFKPQPSSTTLLENLIIDINMSWGNFIYGDSFKSFIIKDSVVNVNSTAKGGKICDISPPNEFKFGGLDGQYDDDERVYVMNLVFDNSVFNNNHPEVRFIYFRDSYGPYCYLDIAFINGSTFNTITSDFISTDENPSENSGISINVAKGTKFSSKNIPIDIDHPKVTVEYYNSITLVDRYLLKEGRTELAGDGEAPEDGETPKLIWGFSGDPEYPNMLANRLVNVTLYNTDGTPISVDMMGYDGYADGLTLRHVLPANGYFFTGEGSELELYENIHAGWTNNVGSDDYVSEITVTEDSSYYPVFKDVGPAAAAVFTSSDMSCDSISKVFMEPVISNYDLLETEGSYLRLFSDTDLILEDTVRLSRDFTLDLGGHKLSTLKSLGSYPVFSAENISLTIKDGSVISHLTFIELKDGDIIFDSTYVNFNVNPFVKIENSTVDFGDCKISQYTENYDVPTVLICGGNTEVKLDKCDVSVSGPVVSAREESNMQIFFADCGTLRACSLFGITRSTAERIGKNSTLSVDLCETDVVSSVLFDVPSLSDGEDSIDAVYNLASGRFSSDPLLVSSGRVILPDGYRVAAVNDGEFSYAIIPSVLNAKFNMQIEYDFIAKFYVVKDESIVSLKTYSKTLTPSELDTVNIDGIEYYVVSIEGISSSDCLSELYVDVIYKNEEGTLISSRIKESPLDYLSTLMESEDPLVARLSATALRYVFAAYRYSGSVLPTEALQLEEGGLYKSLLRDVDQIPNLTDNGVSYMDVAFKSAQLYLSTDVYLVLNIKDGFNGTVEVGDYKYTVTDGKVGDDSRIKVRADLSMLYESSFELVLTPDSGEMVIAEYSLYDYLSSATQNDVADLIEALYAYCYEASVYKNGGVIPPFIDTMPSVGVVIK